MIFYNGYEISYIISINRQFVILFLHNRICVHPEIRRYTYGQHFDKSKDTPLVTLFRGTNSLCTDYIVVHSYQNYSTVVGKYKRPRNRETGIREQCPWIREFDKTSQITTKPKFYYPYA